MNHQIIKTVVATTFLSGLITSVNSDQALANQPTGRGITVTIEAPGVQSTQLPNAYEYYVIDFEDQSGTNTFTKTNGNTTYSYSNDLQVKNADEWGGANVSKYITQSESSVEVFNRTFTINVNESQKYFGFWWSAGDPYNVITFKNNGMEVASLRTENLVNFIDSSGVVSTQDYLGNPNPAYASLENEHKTEPFSFVNVFFNNDLVYDEIVITSEKDNSAFESDNHTFSAVPQVIRGEVISNNAPVANDDTARTTILGSVTIDVLANDTDSDGDAKTISSIDSIFGGNAVIKDNKIIYTAGSMMGQFSLTYTVQDDYGKSDSGVVVIDVTAYPD